MFSDMAVHVHLESCWVFAYDFSRTPGSRVPATTCIA